MILTDYYRMERLPHTKSKHRFDCLKSTKTYPQLEELRNKEGRLFFYFSDVPDTFNAKAQRRADKAITKTKSISSVYIPDIRANAHLGYGDFKGTQDAMLFVIEPDYSAFDLLIARGQKNNRVGLFQLLADGELDKEIAVLKKRAKLEGVAKQQTLTLQEND